MRPVAGIAAGLVATALGGSVHLPRLFLGRARVIDVLGALLVPAGLVLIVHGARRALRGRGWRARLLAIVAGAVMVQWFVVPVLTAGLVINAPRRDAPAASTLGLAGARDVSFRARDGVRLDGWYVPGHRRAAVIVAHGSHGSRADALAHVGLLARAGFAVLAFDARGHGSSAGETNALGWRGTDDVAGAVAFLQRRAEIDPRRIALLGLSMGAEEGLRAAADGVPLRAVVADGAGTSTLGDQRLTDPGALEISVSWLSMRATELLSGTSEPPALGDIVSRIQVPVLLIASNARDEARVDRAYQQRIGERAQLWHVADAGHTRALDRHPLAYAARVSRFLDAAVGHSAAR
jgi:alpha-beta hydrolase superfamily lysophospholipase